MNLLLNRKFRAGYSLLVASGLWAVSSSQAQEVVAAEGSETVKLEKFEVTGSRLTGASAEGALSVSPYKIDTDLSLQGYSNFGEMLRTKLPQYGGGIGTISDAWGNGGSGQTTISLRNLPGSRTLFLVNGRRTTADLNLVPNAAIDTIEVLNDGAAAVYGSEAIAGVVNVKLKKDFTGMYASARFSNTFETDISERRVSVLGGASNGKTRVTLSYEYSRANEQMSADRPNSMPSGDMVSGVSNPGLFTPDFSPEELTALDASTSAGSDRPNRLMPLRWFVNADVTDGLRPGTALPAAFNPSAYILAPADSTSAQLNALRSAEEARLNELMGANSPVRYGPNYVYSSLGDLNPGFPYGYYTTAYRPHDRGMFTASIEHDLIPQSLTVFAEVLYSKNTSQAVLAPSPLGGNTLPATNYWVASILPEQTEGRTFTYGYRPTELGPRVMSNKFVTRRVVAGLRGEIASNWKWEVAAMDDVGMFDQIQSGGVLAGVFTDALEATDQASAFNPFGATPLFGTSSPVNSDELIASFAGSAPSQYRDTIRSIDANIAGELFSLPGGAIAISLGAEYREETDRDMPSLALINGDVFPFNAEPPFSGERSIRSVYAETNIPILGPTNAVPWANKLSISLAGRGEDYSDVGSTGIKPRVALRWEPIADQLTIRGSFAQGFVAPTLITLKPGDRGQDFVEVLNPVTGTRTQPEDGVFLVGNPDLKPSESDTYLAGVVYSPKAVRGLSVGMNYYRIEETGIPFESAQYIVSQWAAAGGADNASNPFGPTAAASAENPTGAQVVVAPSGELEVVRNVGPINSGARSTDGVDLFANYKFDTGFGEFVVGSSWTRVLSFEQENFPGAGTIDYLGKYWGSGAALENYGFPKWKGNASVAWSLRDYSASVGYNFTSGYLEDENDNNKIEAYQTFDARIGYKLPVVDIQLTVGVNNVFDEPPPLVVTSFENGFDRAIADIRGRMWFVELSRRF
jgi:iron complex outermembrane receptor protein